ncbi:YcjF family protein [Endothiovibrio diazotrophicus]
MKKIVGSTEGSAFRGGVHPGAMVRLEPGTPGASGGIVKTHVIASMAIGLVPLPLFDVVALVGVQVKMVHALCNEYGVPFRENLGRSLIASLIGGMLPTATTASLASIIKILPGFGTLAGGASMAILGGALSYAVGKVFIHHFERGGTLIDFAPDRYRDRLRDAFVEGRGVAVAAREGDAAATE